MKHLILLVAIFLLLSCGVISERNVYEGIRSQQIIKDTGNNQKNQTLPPYEQYKQERENQSNR